MTLRLCLMILLSLCSAIAFAQDTHTTTYQTPQGELTVHWGQPPARDFGPPPPFEQLAHGGYISANDADAYPPLANDFIYADSNRDGRISKAEYQRWARSR